MGDWGVGLGLTARDWNRGDWGGQKMKMGLESEMHRLVAVHLRLVNLTYSVAQN